MKVGIIGAVGTTVLTINMLFKHEFEIVGILGHEPDNTKKVSGLQDLGAIAHRLGVDYQGYKKINEDVHYLWMKEREPDIIFAVGFSQLLESKWLSMAHLGCIGFHPTLLPRGRGRAPLAWLVLEEKIGAASFFLMRDGADDGPVFVQERFIINEIDDATSVTKKIHSAAEIALEKWLPDLKKGVWNPVPQDESSATYYGKRSEEDGLIEWNKDANSINRLIRASTKPYPGAFTFYRRQILRVWNSKVESNILIKGTVGRVLMVNESQHLLVQCGDGLIWLLEYESEAGKRPDVGDLLGFRIELELYKLWNEITKRL